MTGKVSASNRFEALKKDKEFYLEEEDGSEYIFGDITGFAYHDTTGMSKERKAGLIHNLQTQVLKYKDPKP